jgi:sugar lactone lactonase YvrE
MRRNKGYASLVVWVCLLIAQQSLAQVFLPVAGGFTGDGGPAADAVIITPQDVVMDGEGNLYVAEGKRIRRIDSSGTIATLIEAEYQVHSIAIGEGGDIYFAAGGQVFKRDSSGRMTLVAGAQNYRQDNENIPAREAFLGGSSSALRIAVDSPGNIYITYQWAMRVWKADVESGIIATIAGTGESADSGDGGTATQAQFMSSADIVIDGSGNLYIADTQAKRVRKVDAATGIIATVAGMGSYGTEEGIATEVGLTGPNALSLASTGELYIGESNRVRKVDAVGNMTIVAGGPSSGNGFSGDGGPASDATFNQLGAVWGDGSGNLYIADTGNSRVRKVDASGIINTIAGGSYGDGKPAREAALNGPMDVALDAAGNVYIADTENSTIRRVDASTGIISTVAGGGDAVGPEYGDGGLAIDAQLQRPYGAFVDKEGNVFIADTNNNRIRKVDTSGIITTVAGSTDWNAPLGDGGPATEAKMYEPTDVYVTEDGTIYIADRNQHRIRKVDPSGTITTVAGDGTGNATGDGGPATSAGVSRPEGVFVDVSGNIYVTSQNAVRKIDTAGNISSLVSYLMGVAGIHGDTEGNLYISQTWSDNQPVSRINSAGEVEILIGKLDNPQGVFYDQANEVLYVVEAGSGRVGKVVSASKMVLDKSEMKLGYLSTVGAMVEVVEFRNEGNRPLEARFSLEGDDVFELSSEALVLDPGASGKIEIRFVPVAEGDYAGILKISSNDPASEEVTIPITGKRSDVPKIGLGRQSFDFGRLLVQHEAGEELVIANQGFLPLVVALSLEEDDGFGLSSRGVVLEAGESERIEVSFVPLREGDYSATLKISSNDPLNEELAVPLSGTGIMGKVVGDEWVSIMPDDLGYIKNLAIQRKSGHVFLNSGWIYRTSDGGESWEKLGDPGRGEQLLLDPEDPQRLYSGGNGRFYWSDDGGMTWQNREESFLLSGAREWAITSSDGEVALYARVYSRHQDIYEIFDLYRSLDRGRTWDQVLTLDASTHSAVVDTAKILNMAVDASNPEKLYVSTINGIYRLPEKDLGPMT